MLSDLHYVWQSALVMDDRLLQKATVWRWFAVKHLYKAHLQHCCWLLGNCCEKGSAVLYFLSISGHVACRCFWDRLTDVQYWATALIFRIRIPNSDTLYRAIKSNHNVLVSRQHELERVQEQLKSLQVMNQTATWNNSLSINTRWVMVVEVLDWRHCSMLQT